MFIELTIASGGKLLLNTSNIEAIQDGRENPIIGLTSGEGYYVKESYKEIKSLLNQAGESI